MLRGMIVVTCPCCGKTLIAPDIEWHATNLSAPVKCPNVLLVNGEQVVVDAFYRIWNRH